MANYISLARIFLVFLLFLTKPFSTVFFVIYITCGISDILDGYIARKTHTTSRLGEKLDSAADLIMVIVVIILLYPIINPTIQILVWIVIIGIIRILSMIIVFVKHKTFSILHTYGNKITGLMLLLFPLLFAIIKSDVMMYVLCIVASVSAVEELAIHLLTKELRANKKSIFEGR
ncbi:MAG: CDP-alcohol phosphatidyltransferase [Firmicutes bacterium HGW-Firmicutes-7]|nr:MAG: CDP-alcohol phosphatidyltransferase [Firmicutes bacterium HGW-Firmicutes-7]